jgi:hypothetical protein
MRVKLVSIVLGVVVLFFAVYGAFLIERGFSARDEPSSLERFVARFVRNVSIPARAAHETNPLQDTPEILREARDSFIDRCAVCHGQDGSGRTQVGQSLHPKTPDLRASHTQNLTDGQIPTS